MAVINDPNTAANIVTVKAASTAAAATDMGAVVHIHPTSLLPGTSRPDNQYRIGMDAASLLYDAFDSTLDTTDRWTTLGTVIPTVTTGTLTVSAGTVASAWSALQSKATFPLLGNMFLQLVNVLKTNAGLTTGNYRFVGFGTLPGTPTAAAPITDGVGFEWIDTTGDMSLVVWAGGTKTQTLSLTSSRPTDGLFHRPAIYYKTSRAYAELDNVTLGSIAMPNPNTSNLPLVILSVNGLATLGAAATLQASFLGAGDSAGNNQEISSGRFPWRKMGVGSEDSSAAHVTVKPIPHNALGHYRTNHRCSIIALQAANSRIFEVRNSGSNLIVPTRLIIKWIQTAAHTAAIEDSLDVFRCTTFSAVDTVNTVTPTTSVKRTAGMTAGPGGAAIRGVTIAGAAAGMTGGTLTKDGTSSGQLPKWLTLAFTDPVVQTYNVLDNFDDVNGTHPFVFANNEGIIIENRVLLGAAAGSSVYIDFSWAEVTAY